MAFTTRDRDNDEAPNNCAFYWRGAWWYRGCFDSNLNGNYFILTDGRGVVWLYYPSTYHMKETTMKLKCG
ncbi:hypothetical protein FSP39_005331 [Pinctada imbricata]|uniref:Fibrinogen C-terminal domain-containing protein n=1 Tax=Pinctada imbricata TaxID=66713 RepID=A0AA89CDS6_PINIB|nr:hypothetical protein FSP39_005331 [Pinctada imbricata]